MKFTDEQLKDGQAKLSDANLLKPIFPELATYVAAMMTREMETESLISKINLPES